MAKPDTDDGWFKLSHELDAALALADFGLLERLVIREMFAATFGKAKLRTVKLNARDIAARAGVGETNLFRAIRTLKNSGVIAEEGDAYRFIKDYENWTRKGKPRLTPTQVEYCKAAPGHSCSFAPKKATPRLKPHKQSSTISQDSKTISQDSDELRCDISRDSENYLSRQKTLSHEIVSAPAPYRNARGIQDRQDRQDVVVVVERAHETPKSQSIVDQVREMILAKSTDPEHMPRGNEQLAEDIAMKASGWVRDGLSPSAILEAYRLACEAVENPWKVQPYAAKVVRSLDNKLKTEATAPAAARPLSASTVPIGLSPAELRRQAENEALRARFGRKEPASG